MRRKTKTTNDSSSSSSAATFNAPAKKAANSGYPSGRYVPIAPRPTPIAPPVIMSTTTAAANIQQIQKPIAPRKPAKIDPTDWWFDDDDQPPVVIVEPSSSTNHQRISHEHDRAAAAVAATTTTADFGSDSQFRRYSLQRNDLSSEFANLAVRVHPARPMVNKSRRKRYQSPLRKTILKKQCNERLKCLQPQGYPAVSEAQPNVPYLAGVPPQLYYKSSSDHKFYRINNQQQQPSIVDLQVSPCLPRKSIVYYGSHQAYHPVPQLSSSSSSIEQLPKLKNFKTASATLNPHKLDSTTTMMMKKMIPISTKRPPIAIVQPGPPGLHFCRQQPPPSSAKVGSDTKLLDLRPLEERRAGAKQPSAADSKVPIAVDPKQAITTNPAQQQHPHQQQQVDKPEHVIHQSSPPQLLPTDPFAVTLISGTTFVFDPRVFEHSVFGCRPSAAAATTNKKPIANPAAIDQQPTTPKDATRKSKKTAPLNDFFKVPIPSNLEIQLFNNQNPPECCSPATSSLTDQPVRRLKQPERVRRVLVSSLNKSRLDEVKDAILKRSVVWQNSEQIIRDEDPWEVEFVRRIINNPNQNQSGSKMMM